MNARTALEIFGYIGSALVVISMLMSSIVKLRIINTVGSVISFVYAMLCGAMPLALMNICLIIINLISLLKLSRAQHPFELVTASPEDSLVKYFLNYYKEDIRHFFPGYSEGNDSECTAVMVCREGNPAGILLGKCVNDTFDVVIDYSTPMYRDCSVGKYLYSKLQDMNIHFLKYSQELTDEHRSYLEKMGYQQKDGIWVCNIG